MLMFFLYFIGHWFKSKDNLQLGWSLNHLLCPIAQAAELLVKLFLKCCYLQLYISYKCQNEVKVFILSGVLLFAMSFLESEPRDVP